MFLARWREYTTCSPVERRTTTLLITAFTNKECFTYFRGRKRSKYYCVWKETQSIPLAYDNDLVNVSHLKSNMQSSWSALSAFWCLRKRHRHCQTDTQVQFFCLFSFPDNGFRHSSPKNGRTREFSLAKIRLKIWWPPAHVI